jgi:hypothetical protein
LENIPDLFISPSLVPVRSDTLENQMNAMCRLVILTFIICCLCNVYVDYRFLVAALFLIIVAYYALHSFQRTCKEAYGLVDTVVEPVPPVAWNTGTNDFVFSQGQDNVRAPCVPGDQDASFTVPRYPVNPQLVDTGQSQAWCPQNLPLEEIFSTNQSLVGPPNPKTLVRPVIPTPIYDTEAWKPNDFIIPNGINDQKRQELFDNGYVAMEHVSYVPSAPLYDAPTARLPPPPPPSSEYYRAPMSEERRSQHPPRIPVEQVESEEHYEPTGNSSNPYQTFSYPAIDGGCGYDPINLDYHLPVNYKADECQKTKLMREYNKNLFSIPLQPGLYTESQVNQPDASMSNLGISFAQPFLPTAFTKRNGYDSFVELAQPMPPKNVPFPKTDEPLRTEIYDPRLTGYGTSYRSYYEPVTGQTRFYYDDVDQQTRYNYLTRNKVDFANFGTTVGPINDRSLQGQSLYSYADQTYSDSQVTFRNEMQQRLMHKNSNREWQQRIAPISTRNTAQAGGGRSNSGGSYAGPRG